MSALGKVVATPGFIAFCEEAKISPLDALARYLARDWSEMCAEDRAENARAITEGSRIFSAYSFQRVKVFVITEADRSSTCLLLAEDY